MHITYDVVKLIIKKTSNIIKECKNNISSFFLQYLSASILSLSGVLFIIWHDNLPALVAGRALAGICNGIVFLALLVHAAENTIKALRGLVLSSIGFLKNISTFLATLLFIIPYYNPSQVPYPSQLPDPSNSTEIIHISFDVDLLLGIVTFVYAIIALLTIPYLTYESVPFLIQQRRERKGLENFIKLRNEPTDTWAIRNEFDEMRLMVIEDYRAPGRDHRNIFADGNGRPLLLIIGVRMMMLLSSNLPFQLTATIFTKLLPSDNGIQYAMMILLGSRVGLGILPVLFTDKFGRKCFLFTSGILCGVCMIAQGITLLLDDLEIFDLDEWVPGTLFICFYMFASIGIDNVGNVLTAEAFPLAKKAWSIAFAMVIEHTIQCLFLIWLISVRLQYEHMIAVIFITGFGLIGLSVWLQRVLPETRGMSLRQCRDEFNKTRALVSFTGRRNRNMDAENGITYA